MKEWYMTGQTPDATGGFETDAISDYAQSNFTDVLLTGFADDVVIYNHDMSESTEMKALVQGNTADTSLKSTERSIQVPIGILKAGMYVKFEDSMWLINGRPGNNKSYEKAIMELCNWELKWQNKKGEIISRFAITSSAAKYNSGENNSNVIVLGSDQLAVQIPLDIESIGMKRGIKFFIDCDLDDPTVYELTNPRNVEYNYGKDNGVTNWIVKECAYSPTVDDLEHGVCNYIAPTTPSQPTTPENPDETVVSITSTISGNTSLKVGFPRTYSVIFMDKNGAELSDVEFSWNIASDFNDEIDSTINGKNITLQIDNEDYVDEQIVLQIMIDGTVNSELTITITGQF